MNALKTARAELDHASTRLQEIRALHKREKTAHQATRHLLQRAMVAPTAAASKGKSDPASLKRLPHKRDSDEHAVDSNGKCGHPHRDPRG
jgi:hypothetical protein